MLNKVRINQGRLWIGIAACVAAGIGLLWWFYEPRHSLDEKTVSAAQDEIYAIVVRDMITPAPGQTRVSQLVFDDAALTNLTAETDKKSCEENVRKELSSKDTAPPYNSFIDKAYRVLTNGWWNPSSLRTDTIQDFAEKSCSNGRISTRFHTDLPRTFVPVDKVHFEGWPVGKDGTPPFEKLFPGAAGIIAFSRVGFDSSLDEAIVSTSFYCGGLCGAGRRYILKIRRGKWEVTNKRLIWVS